MKKTKNKLKDTSVLETVFLLPDGVGPYDTQALTLAHAHTRRNIVEAVTQGKA